MLTAAKGLLACFLETLPPLRALVRLAEWLLVRRQRVGVLALLQADGLFLVGRHVFRQPQWGLLGGWLRRGEPPEEGLLRELREELGEEMTVQVGRLLVAMQQPAEAGARGLILVYECRARRAELPPRLPLELLELRWVPLAEALRLIPLPLAMALEPVMDSTPI